MAGSTYMAMQPASGADLKYPVRDGMIGQTLHSSVTMWQALQSTGTDLTGMHA